MNTVIYKTKQKFDSKDTIELGIVSSGFNTDKGNPCFINLFRKFTVAADGEPQEFKKC